MNTQTENQTKTLNQIAFFTAIKIILLFIIFGLLLWQGMKFLQNKARILSEKKAMILVLQKRENQGKTLQDDWAKIESDFPTVEGALVSKDDLTGFIGKLEEISTKSGVEQILKFDEKETTDKNTSAIGFELTLKGNLSNFVSYLGSFQSLPYIIKIEKIELSSSQSLQKEGQATIKAKLYLQKTENITTSSSTSTTATSTEELK
jgi:Tfp pilus assembly protein PilO